MGFSSSTLDWTYKANNRIKLLQGGGTDEERPSKYKNCIKGSKNNRQDLHPLRMIISNYPTKIPKL